MLLWRNKKKYIRTFWIKERTLPGAMLSGFISLPFCSLYLDLPICLQEAKLYASVGGSEKLTKVHVQKFYSSKFLTKLHMQTV